MFREKIILEKGWEWVVQFFFLSHLTLTLTNFCGVRVGRTLTEFETPILGPEYPYNHLLEQPGNILAAELLKLHHFTVCFGGQCKALLLLY